ncbi:MAG: hypothetical protein RIR48_2625 [Bacteroidota bacterium]
MASYIFHNETRSEVAFKKLLICPEDIMNSYLVNGAYFRAIIKDNEWDTSDIICAISDDDVPMIVYDNGNVMLCDDMSHYEKLEETFDKAEKYDLENDELIVLSCEEESIICDCGCPSDNDVDFYERDTEYEDTDKEDNWEYEDDIESEVDVEEDIWALRRKMIGLKNITDEKIQEIRKGYFQLSGKKMTVQMRVELGMDIIKYAWKMTIREFISEKYFKEICDEIFHAIEKNLNKMEKYMTVEYENFKEDILSVSSMKIKN